ncbi:MAG: hypothetical protein Q7T82_21620 [Armatimonadota bacterium]|nr:hypothetical protein [Armatimonadota bacterium]
MKLICVGGTSSGCGKTSVVSLLLQALPGWAAVKVTPSREDGVCPHGEPCSACVPPEAGYEVVTGPEILSKFGKDTARFMESAPSRVAWARAPTERIPEALESALAEFPDAPGAIIESTTAMPVVDGLRILVTRVGLTEVKDSARRAAESIDLLAVNVEANSDWERVSMVPRLRELAPRAEIVRVCAVLPPEDAMNTGFIAAVRLAVDGWFGDSGTPRGN